ncbi:MAG: hypothetical protein ABEJ58_07875 [Halodesulfurarchaeum sp.]
MTAHRLAHDNSTGTEQDGSIAETLESIVADVFQVAEDPRRI